LRNSFNSLVNTAGEEPWFWNVDMSTLIEVSTLAYGVYIRKSELEVGIDFLIILGILTGGSLLYYPTRSIGVLIS
jgi:hypothetical protein